MNITLDFEPGPWDIQGASGDSTLMAATVIASLQPANKVNSPIVYPFLA